MRKKISLSVDEQDIDYLFTLYELLRVGPAVAYSAGLEALKKMAGPELQILMREVENRKAMAAYQNRTAGQRRAGKEQRNGKGGRK